MVYDEQLAEKIRQSLAQTKNVVEKKMFGGLGFLVNEKMCVGVWKNQCIVRCDPSTAEQLLKKKGTHVFDITGKPMQGWLLVDSEGMRTPQELNFWIMTALAFNGKAKSAKNEL